MHASAAQCGRYFFERYGLGKKSVLDIGAQDFNGSLRPSARNLQYVGLDIEPGPGVDAVSPPGEAFPFPDASFDLVTASSCFEHDPCFWATFAEGLRVLKDGGYFYISAPSNGEYHGYPYDNWRFYPDAGRALTAWGRRCGFDVRLVESGTLRQDGDIWNDFIAIFQKAPFSDPSGYVVDAFPNAMNVRRGENGELERFSAKTEDVQRLNDAMAQLSAIRGSKLLTPLRTLQALLRASRRVVSAKLHSLRK